MLDTRSQAIVRLRMRLRQLPLLHGPLVALKRLGQGGHRFFFWLCRRLLPARVGFGPPRGVFSERAALQSGQSGQSEGGIILEDQGSPHLPEPSIMLLCRRTQHLQQPWPILFSHHRQARLIGPGLVHLDSQGRMSLEAAYGEKQYRDDPAWMHFTRGKPLFLPGPWTSLVSRWLPNAGKNWYAHWLLDGLPRLALLDRFPPHTGILIPPLNLRYQEESLQLLGLAGRTRKTPEQNLLVEDYYFSSPPSMIVSYSPYAVRFLRSALLPKARLSGGTPKRFFIRRTSWGRNMVNEAEVLDFFRQRGWAIVDTAELGFREQIEWFAQAEAVCAIHGSATANMVWCAPGCRFLELFAADYLAGDQEWIAQCVQVDYHFMIFPSDYKLDAQVDLGQLQRKLAELKLDS